MSQLLVPLSILFDLEIQKLRLIWYWCLTWKILPESSSDDEVKSGSTVTESASEDEDLAGDWGSVKQQLQSEVQVVSKACLTYANS